MRSSLIALAVLTLTAPATRSSGELEGARDVGAEAIVQGWLDQHRRIDSLEAYELRAGTARIEFSIARKWSPNGARVFVALRSPRSVRGVALLFRQNGDRGPVDGWIYLPSGVGGPAARRARRLPPIATEIPIPGTRISLPSSLLFPLLTNRLELRRLSDTRVADEDCYVFESRELDARPDQWTELVLSKRTGVAVRTTVYRRGAPAWIVRAPVRNLRQDLDRWRPGLLRIENPRNGATADLILRNLMLEPDLPDRLFTEHNLRVQRFPGF